MILSHEHRFIFLKTHKTAGTSMDIALSRCGGPRDVITPVGPDERLRHQEGYRRAQNYLEPLCGYGLGDWGRLLLSGRRKWRFLEHMSAARIRELVGTSVWDSYYKFCFERNPWDKVISAYYFRTRLVRRISLSEFILRGQFRDFVDFDLYTIDGQIAVDFVGRYERLAADWESVCRRLNLPALELPHAKSGLRSDRRPYHEILGASEAQMIASAYHREIERLGYRFAPEAHACIAAS